MRGEERRGPGRGRPEMETKTSESALWLGEKGKKRSWCPRDEKPIPFATQTEVLDSWERCGIAEWGMEEVLAWAMSVARRHRIQPEDISLHKFVALSGLDLLKHTPQQLYDLSPKMGQHLYEDLCRVESAERRANAEASSSRRGSLQCLLPTSLAPEERFSNTEERIPPLKPAPSTTHLIQYLSSSNNQLPFHQPSFLDQFFPPTIPAAGSQVLSLPASLSPKSRRLDSNDSPPPLSRHQSTERPNTADLEDIKPNLDDLLESSRNTFNGQSRKANLLRRWEEDVTTDYPALSPVVGESDTDTLAERALAINRSIFSTLNVKTDYARALEGQVGMPMSLPTLERRPSPIVAPFPNTPTKSLFQEQKGNHTPDSLDREEQEFRANFPPRNKRAHGKKHVLWQFILLCLGDPAACPSVVRWEDRQRGIFRIVNSLDLAKLWGQRKNRNKSMSYEKLSRAMRAYYKEGILFPGPRSGHYPKKLVYQFGPNAEGWQEVAGGLRVTDVFTSDTTALSP